MKNILFLFFPVLAILLFACESKDDPDPEQDQEKTITMGANHTHDVYYNLDNQLQTSVMRSDWDLSFSVPLQTATIRINEGAGVMLYPYGDTTAWNTVDTSGMAYWTPVYNDNSDWMNGAFNRGATGGFNFGWGTYDHASTFSVWGDSIYVIRLTNGDIKKLFVRKRLGHSDTYELRWANIDGSNQVDASFSPAPYADTKHFIQYSLVTNEVVEAEPDKDDWDLVFTKYIVKIPAGPVTLDYPVVGVLMKKGLSAAEVSGIPQTEAVYTDAAAGFVEDADVIGWEWKVNDPVTHQTSLDTNVSYFVKPGENNIYKLYFTGYNSAAEGQIVFKVIPVE